MEMILSLTVLALTGIIIFVVEKFVYRKEASPEEIEEYQLKLNEQKVSLKQYGIDADYDTKEEMVKEKRTKKGFLYICIGFIVVLIFFVMIFAGFKEIQVLLSVMFSIIYLIILGLSKFADSKAYLLKILALVFIIFIVFHWFLNNLINLIF